MTSTKSELLQFARDHLFIGWLVLPLIVIVTLLHETAHALVAVVQGATITDFVFLPGHHGWGYVGFTFPEGAKYSHWPIIAAPYLMWLTVASIAGLLSLRKKPYRHRTAALIFIVLFAIPLGDILHAAIGHLLGGQNDFHQLLGQPSTIHYILTCLGLLAAGIAALPLHRHLYQTHALSERAYIILYALTVMLIIAVATVRVL